MTEALYICRHCKAEVTLDDLRTVQSDGRGLCVRCIEYMAGETPRPLTWQRELEDAVASAERVSPGGVNPNIDAPSDRDLFYGKPKPPDPWLEGLGS